MATGIMTTGITTTIIGCAEGHYESKEVAFGTVYTWCPGRVFVECECGEMATLTHGKAACKSCGTDHGSIVRERLAKTPVDDKSAHPWRYDAAGNVVEFEYGVNWT